MRDGTGLPPIDITGFVLPGNTSASIDHSLLTDSL